MRVVVLLMILGLGAAALSGCAAAVLVGAGAGATVGTVNYIQGEHQQVHAATLDRTWAATLAALKQMDIRTEKSTKDALGGSLEAKRADGSPVTIKVEPVGGDAARVKIRIGLFGDKAASELIQARISANLGGK